MFLEKSYRYVRYYRFTFSGRKTTAPTLPLIAPDGAYSIVDAISAAWKADEANVATSNGEIVEIVDLKMLKTEKAVAILFHRSHPDAADPSYRKKMKGVVSVRAADRQPNEEQSVSAHVIIKIEPTDDGRYDVIFEEIPGLPATVITSVFSKILSAYEYPFKDKHGEEQQTYTVLKTQGIKSESVTHALKTGNFGYITLSRPARAKFVDGDDTFQVLDERMKIRIKEEIDADKWYDVLGRMARGARAEGWEDFHVDIVMDDERRKTIKVDRGQEGKEILFVRSAQVSVKGIELASCAPTIVPIFVKAALKG